MQTVGEKYFSEMLVSSQLHPSRGRLLSSHTNVVVTYADCRRKVLLRNAVIQPATYIQRPTVKLVYKCGCDVCRLSEKSTSPTCWYPASYKSTQRCSHEHHNVRIIAVKAFKFVVHPAVTKFSVH